MQELDRARSGRASLRWPTAATFVVVFAVRFWFSSARHVFHVSPDEPSQLAIARFLAGGQRWNMFDHATWQPLLGTLISPIYWFTSDGETAVRWALGVNAAIGGLGAAVLVLLTRRLTGLGGWTCAAIATVIAVAPSSLSASTFVWAEPLVALAVVSTVLLLLRFVDTDRFGLGAAAIVASVLGYTAHSRLLPLIATTLLLTVGRELWRRRWDRAGGLWIVGMAGIIVSARWKSWLLDRIWDDPSNQNTVGAVRNRLGDPLAVAESLVGQMWYQLAATLGVFGLGAVVVLGRAFSRRRRAGVDAAGPQVIAAGTVADGHEPAPDLVTPRAGGTAGSTVDTLTRPDESTETSELTGPTAASDTASERDLVVTARIVLVTVLPLVGLSAVFMSDRGRPDQYIYGRYNDAVVWPVLVFGLAWLVERATTGVRRRDVVTVTALAIATVATGAVVEALHGDEIRDSYGVRGMIAGLLAHVDDTDTLDVWRTTWVATGLFLLIGAMVVVGRRSGGATPAVFAVGGLAAVGLLAVGAVRTREVSDDKLNGWDKAAAVREIDELVPTGASLGVRPVPSSQDPGVAWVPQRQRYMLYQLYLPDRSFVRDRGTDDGVGPYVFAPLADAKMLEADARLLWSDPAIAVGLWQEPPTP